MRIFSETQVFLQFDEADKSHLLALSEHLPEHIDGIIDRFYLRVQNNPRTSALLSGPKQITVLKQKMTQWLSELLQGPWDEAYRDRRMQIGYTHVRVGLPPHFMAAAMGFFSTELTQLIPSSCSHDVFFHTTNAIQRVCQLDLAIMTSTFIKGQEERQLSVLQELIVSHIPVSIFLINHSGQIITATVTGQHLFSSASIIGKPYQSAIPPNLLQRADLHAHITHALSTGNEVELTRVDCVIADEARSFRIVIVPLQQADLLFLLHFEELTDAVQTESRLRRAESLAQLGALSAAVAHELRNPLAGISGAIQIIQRSMDSSDRRKGILIKVDAQIKRLNELVTDLLAFARPHKVALECVNLAVLMRSVIHSVQLEFPESHLQSSGEGFAFTDPDLIHQIALNLLRNAVQAKQSSDHRVVVQVKEASISVCDTGPGVPNEIKETIFEPFFTTRTQGTGLGLAISKKAAKEIGGQLFLKEDSAWGSVFVLTLMPIMPT